MDTSYMKLALELSKKGEGRVNPNPMVGAVIVKNNKIIGTGYHEFYGGPHGEINAFKNATEDVEGAIMYVTLEPCSHFGKTPPCAEEIIKRKIKKVVIGMMDPNPLVAGRGIKKLRENGIEVIEGVLEEQCRAINEIFINYIKTKKPFVVMKSAMTLDGKIASCIGKSKWITGEEARLEVHKLRGKVSAIMVGIGTVLADDPKLTCRVEGYKNPIPVIVDSKLRIPLDSNIIKLAIKEKKSTIIATTERACGDKIEKLRSLGIEVIVLPEENNYVCLSELMKKLGEMGIDSLLLEGGATLNYSAIKANIVNRVQFYIAPKIIGGACSKTPIGGEGIPFIKESIKIDKLSTKFVGEDILVEGYVKLGEDKCLQE